MPSKSAKVKDVSGYKSEYKKSVNILLGIASLVFFGITPLLNFKPAYDYTVIKDILGALFVAIFAVALYLKKDDILINLKGFIVGTIFFCIF